MQKPKVIVICGPTASGKTALSIELAKKVNGEIVSCDSMQIYKDMNIGTAKPTKEEMQGIKHYLLDFVLPNKRYSVAEYKKDAESAIEEIIKKGKTPIVVGGTGLYIDALIYGVTPRPKIANFSKPPPLIRLNTPRKSNSLYKEPNQGAAHTIVIPVPKA